MRTPYKLHKYDGSSIVMQWNQDLRIRREDVVFFAGKNCEQDIPECEGIAESPGNPCLHGALCFERSNVSLYQNESFALLPEDVKDSFSRPFAHKNAGGYVCRSGHKLSCSVGFFQKISDLPGGQTTTHRVKYGSLLFLPATPSPWSRTLETLF